MSTDRQNPDTVQAMPAGYKPSPLGYGSPRSSPFRRPESPVSPSPLRQTTPLASPFRSTGAAGSGTTPTAAVTPSARFAGSPTPVPTNGGGSSSWTPKKPSSDATVGGPALGSAHGTDDVFATTPTPLAGTPTTRTAATKTATAMAPGAALAQLQPAQVRTLREGFQILDRDSDGTVNRDDVADMLHQLGLPAAPADVAPFFPPAAPQTIAMGAFLNTLASALAALSPSTELLAALAAFDEDDSGQIDVAELRDALLHTAPEPGEPPLTEADVQRVLQGFTGRRAFTNSNKSRFGGGGGAAAAAANGFGKRGEVFRYQEFVQSMAGSAQDHGGEGEANREV
ncbi:EF-hand-like domain protein [Niveomyces insectorum RCEF 264]|uniref:EF-hand-like domain protein n=1 Tax=Niveomyces insectorum RCEF 264 TaxID=1081102 RepID=A0A167RHT9_9HYPO|nr:EF-hand-like domain protein [Niveomyces insectorum RCEF 264]